MKTFLLLFLLLPVQPVASQEVCLSAEERKLYDLIMGYRKSRKLPTIPYSAKLTKVAQAHVRDLVAHFDYENRAECNPHSWSDQGNWTPCCYTPDHKQAACMWNKPKEIAGYESEGYEIAFYSSDGAEAEESLAGWKSSPGHHPVIVNEGTWKDVEWKSIGLGIFGTYAVVWFGVLEDKSVLSVCK
ncbi:MAG: CAP domain-containing protein [Cyclobacteriaceae bacterium]|nr:CAP domain-containing protein [Cyclobacteriaceae bacterium]